MIEIPKTNISLEQLGLINQGLFSVDGELARRYHQVLKHVFDLECDVDSFRVDKRGLSPELCRCLREKYPDRLEFGENYLNIRSANRFMIIVSPDQKSAHLVAPQTSYEDELYGIVYKLARHTIEDITQSEALYGELENGIDVFRSAEDLLQFRTIEISLDTLASTVKSILELKAMSSALGKEDSALNPEYIEKMQELVKKVGNVKNRSVSDIFPIKREIHCFYEEFFKGVHCLRNFRNEDNVQAIFISHHQGTPRDLGEEVISIDLHDPKLLDILHEYRFLRYNQDLIAQRAQEIEDETLLAAGIDVVDLNPHERKRKVIEYASKFPQSWHELREIAGITESTRRKIDKVVKDKSYETRLKLSEAASKKEIIEHMLAELDPTDPVRIFEANRRKLITEFPNLPLNRQRYIAYTLLNYTQGGK